MEPTGQPINNPKIVTSLLDAMVDGREYESIVMCLPQNMDVANEIRRSLAEIAQCRKRPCVCYAANLVTSIPYAPVSIDRNDDVPFLEMIRNIPSDVKEIDIILITPGGSGECVAHYVTQLRNRFENIGFIIPFYAMSAGTMFCLSGDEVIMSENACIGPIDPQVPTRDGRFVPAQSILALINDIQIRGAKAIAEGKQPDWTDVQILRNLDPKEIGNAITASQFSIDLVKSYLKDYKFRTWTTHEKRGGCVTAEEKEIRAEKIAKDLCDNSLWKTHSRGISRELAHKVCKLKITHPESIEGLDAAIRRFWALLYWLFERNPVCKIFISENYSLFRGTQTQQIQRVQQVSK